MSNYPIRHESTVAAARYSQPISINPRVALQHRVDTAHYIAIVFAAPLADDAAFKLLPVTGRASGIREEHCITVRGVDLKLVIPIDAILSGRSAMDAENHGILFPGLPVDWFDEEAIDVPIVGALVCEAFDIGKLQLPPQRLIEIGEFALLCP